VIYVCTHIRRLLAVKLAGVLNGIEYIEVRDTDEPVQALRQRTLYVRLLLPVPAAFTAANVILDGGERIHTVPVEWAAPATALPAALSAAEQAALLSGLDEPDHVFVIRTTIRGDFSQYRLALVAGAGTSAAPAGFDPLLVAVDFSFKVECPSPFDCMHQCSCPPFLHTAPAIDYLAKDFDGFRRIMLERMALLAPGWTERNPADVGVALVELLAYVADELSYRQDAVATEAYLGTARSRVSIRRHARLVDYRVHEGCNARAWVQIDVNSPIAVLPARTTLFTTVPGLPALIEPDSRDFDAAAAAGPVVFETVDPAVLHSDLTDLDFYTWGEQGCCLPRGATSATLLGRHPNLRAGDVLALAETVSPTTGEAADANPTRRWAVRLIDVRPSSDPSGGLFHTPPDGTSVEVTEIRWDDQDALPFPLCLSVADGARTTAKAWGNIVLADHGQTISGEDLGSMPKPRLVRVGADAGCEDTVADVVPARYRPTLDQRPLTHVLAAPAAVRFEAPLDPTMNAELTARTFGPGLQALFAAHGLASIPAASAVVRGAAPLWSVSDGTTVVQLRADGGTLQALAQPAAASQATAADPRAARPALTLTGTDNAVADPWLPQPDLLVSDGSAREFTAETEADGTVLLRFGDDEHGLRPGPATAFTADYRIGNGTAGNVGAEAIGHAVTTVSAVTAVRNPLPAAGGVEPETADEVRRDAPYAFAVQERAVTEDDYAEVAQRQGQVQRAAATFRWTGSWHTVFVTADRLAGKPVDAPFETGLRNWLERYRMAGYDLEVAGPVPVPLELGLHVCVSPGHFRPDVEAAVLTVLGTGVLPDGQRGLFHPDNLTFGQPVYLSGVYAAVHAVSGVESVEVHTFQRQRQPQTSGIEAGVLPMGRLEIARLDNDPNFPERGVLDLTMGGGT